MNIENFINKVLPHGKNNSAPPNNPIRRHEWESKLLYTIKDVLKEECKIIDYGCGGSATLRHTLRKHCVNSTYYGLDITDIIDDNKGFDKLVSQKNEMFYNIDKLDVILPQVDGMVLGSVFTHLGFETIKNILDKTLSHYERGFQLGFSTFFGCENKTYSKHHTMEDYYWVVVIGIEWISDYCEKNGLQLIINPFRFELDHTLPMEYIRYQSFATIKK
jgi:hypothetical protein